MSDAELSAEQVRELADSTIAAAGMDLEDCTATPAAGGGTAFTMIVDADGGVDLDALADVTRELVAALDAEYSAAVYTLEITTPGIGRPLTEPRHWRRARGRKVAIELAGDSPRRVSGRVGRLTESGVEIVRNDRGRLSVDEIRFDAIARAVVEVDFSTPGAAELEMCGGPAGTSE